MAESAPLIQSALLQEKPKPSTAWSYVQLTRVHKFPAGSNLVFWPGAWGVTLSACKAGLSIQQVMIQVAMYLLGSTLRHNAACIWNDICDRDFDRQVERTKSRPLASGAVSLFGAVILLAAHIILCVGVLVLSGDAGVKVGLFGLLVLDPLYPLMKRWTNWPQAWLGLAMTWGFPTSWVSINGFSNMTVPVAVLAGGTCWSIYYDTIYACQDRRDDIKAGVKSTAVLFGNHIRPILSGFGALFVASLVYAGLLTNAGAAFFVISVLGAAAQLMRQMVTLDFNNGAQCWSVFKANGTMVGATIWIGMFLDYFVRVSSIP